MYKRCPKICLGCLNRNKRPFECEHLQELLARRQNKQIIYTDDEPKCDYRVILFEKV